MGDKVIEPSEIITGREEPKQTNPSRANPWIRFIARFFDYSLFFAILQLLSSKVNLLPFERWLPIEFFAWIPIETLLLWSWGTTPGKWLLRTKLKRGHVHRLSFDMALRRSFAVWFRGLGMGIPFINVICLISSYYRLKVFQLTSWDRDEKIQVVHYPLPQWRFYGTTALTIIGMIFYLSWRNTWF